MVTEKKKKISAASAAEKPKAVKVVKKATAKPKVAKPKAAKAVKPKTVIPAAAKPRIKKEKPAVEAPKPSVAPVAKAPSAIAPPPPPIVVVTPLKKAKVKFPIGVKDLARELGINPTDIIKLLMKKGKFVTINQSLDEAASQEVAKAFGFELEKLPSDEEVLIKGHFEEEEDKTKLKLRPPVVTMMGHVDHGKTSLLDAIRKTNVVDREAGGITQHIGAYEVELPGKGFVTFLDTPGHQAFTAMRARGANATDVVVLVVAADDGIMPQTSEAIDHAKAAEVPIVVAINKIDKPNANVDRVKKQLMEVGLASEDWGGKTIALGVSAKTGEGIDHLLEMLLLEAELLELKANPDKPARGVVIEAKLTKGRGPTATILVQNGTLRIGDVVITGNHFGKVRSMINDKGKHIKDAPPSTPVEISGISGVAQAGDTFFVVEDERKAREIALVKQEALREKKLKGLSKVTLEDLFERIKQGKVKELKVVLKADVQGSLEALNGQLEKLGTPEVKLCIIHKGIGDITEADAMLASASDAVIIGFHVGVSPEAEARVKEEGVDLRLYDIIYQVVDDVHKALEGLLEPHLEEMKLGEAVVKQVFKVTKAGNIAGCQVSKGKIVRAAHVRVMRAGEKVFEGKLAALKRFKDDVKEVTDGFECGMQLEGFSDIRAGDVIESFEIKKTARKL